MSGASFRTESGLVAEYDREILAWVTATSDSVWELDASIYPIGANGSLAETAPGGREISTAKSMSGSGR